MKKVIISSGIILSCMQLFGSVDSDYISGSEDDIRQEYVERRNERYNLEEVCMHLRVFIKNILKYALEEEYLQQISKDAVAKLNSLFAKMPHIEGIRQEKKQVVNIVMHGQKLYASMKKYHQLQSQSAEMFKPVEKKTKEQYEQFKSALELFYQDLFNLGEENEYLLQRLADKLGLKSAIYWTDEQMYQAKQQYLPAQQKHISMRKQHTVPTRFTVKHIILTGRGDDGDHVLYVE